MLETGLTDGLSQIKGLHLGLGLLAMGRVWGVLNNPVPSEEEASTLLKVAIANDITFFDTAPAYALSEKRLGLFLETFSRAKRSKIVVATKMGEHWDFDRDLSYVDHSRDALCRSIDQSKKLLGDISLLQLHKATPDVIAHPDTLAALSYARSCGITQFGASVSSLEAAKLALETGIYSTLQFPYNISTRAMEPLFKAIEAAGATAIINRPFGMGATVHGKQDKTQAGIAAFQFLRDNLTRGVVLTGTGKTEHLEQNIEMFRAAVENYTEKRFG